jgi:hypothetical protein
MMAEVGQERASMRTVVAASSAGTAFEWYDFFIFGSLTQVISKTFFAGLSDTAGYIAALALFGVGFAFRPLGALVFGKIGDQAGRKGAFLATVLSDGRRDLRHRLPADLPAGRDHLADPADPDALRAGLRPGRRIWRGGDLCRRALAVGQARLVDLVGADLGRLRPVRRPAGDPGHRWALGKYGRRRGPSTPGAGASRSPSRSACWPSRSGCG